MSYQIALILILLVASFILVHKFTRPRNIDKELVYEDVMDHDDL